MDLKKTEAYLVAETFNYSFEGKVTDIPLPSYWTPEMSVMHRRRDPSTYEQIKTRLRIY
jgi:hypothetical protein